MSIIDVLPTEKSTNALSIENQLNSFKIVNLK